MRSRGNCLKLLIYEHASAGGYAEGSVSPSMLSEGFGMLRSAVSCFKAAGHNVTVVLADGLSKLNPPLNTDCVLPVSNFKEAQDTIRKACGKVDAALVVAPETGGVLQSLVELVEQTGVASLNCKSAVIRAVSNKADLYEKLKAKGIIIPETISLSFSDDLSNIKSAIKGKFSFPVLFKPVEGEGCSGISIASSETQIDAAIAKVKSQSQCGRFLVQEYLTGHAASVSLLSTGEKALPLSLNEQKVTLATPDGDSSYDGGVVPFEHPFWLEALDVAQQVADCFCGLRGYFGVDVVLSADGPVVVDVNPRLTTSFVGLSSSSGLNVSEALLNAVLKRELPSVMFFQGFACFEKLRTPVHSISVLQRLYGLREVVSPPFPVPSCNDGCALILCKGNTAKEAVARLEEAKKHTLNIINRGK